MFVDYCDIVGFFFFELGLIVGGENDGDLSLERSVLVKEFWSNKI